MIADWKIRIRASGVHLALSVAVTMLAAGVVFGLWYPYPFQEISGGKSLFLLIVVVDLTLGPVLTCVVFNRRKPMMDLVRDLTIIGVIQIAALGYGLWSVYKARPVYLVHEVDRFVVVSAANIDPADLPQAKPEFRRLPFAGVRLIGLRESQPGDERLRSLLMAAAGKDMSFRPDYWQPISEANREVIRKRAKPLFALRNRSEAEKNLVDEWLKNENRDVESLVYFPLVGRNQYWTVILDKSSLDILGYLNVDAF